MPMTPIGSRRTATEGSDLTSYTSNNLNQYKALSGAKTAAPLHDDDGNVTDYPYNDIYKITI